MAMIRISKVTLQGMQHFDTLVHVMYNLCITKYV